RASLSLARGRAGPRARTPGPHLGPPPTVETNYLRAGRRLVRIGPTRARAADAGAAIPQAAACRQNRHSGKSEYSVSCFNKQKDESSCKEVVLLNFLRQGDEIGFHRAMVWRVARRWRRYVGTDLCRNRCGHRGGPYRPSLVAEAAATAVPSST